MKAVKNKVNAIVNVITTIIIILLCISLISNFQTTFLGKKYNDFFGYALFEVKTASMAGTVEINDWILVKITDEVELNDVITFEQDGAFVTHRVIEVYKDTYVTKGDSNNTKDTPIKKEQIVGKMEKVLPRFGIVKKTILNEKVLILLIITIFLFCSIFKKDNKEKKTNITNNLKGLLKEKKEKIIVEETPIKVNTLQKDDTLDLSKTTVLSKITVDANSLNLKSLEETDEIEEYNSKIEINPTNQNKYNELKSEIEAEKIIEESGFITQKDIEKIVEKTAYEKTTDIDSFKDDEESIEKDETIEEDIEDDEEIEEENDNDKNKKRKIGKTEKNVIKKNIELKKKEVLEIVKILLETDNLEGEIKSIVNKFINEYVNIKYLKQCDYEVNSVKELKKVFNTELESFSNKLIRETSKNTTVKTIRRILNIFMLINKIDSLDSNLEKTINECTYVNLNDKETIIKKLKKLLKTYSTIYEDFLKKLENDKFNLITKKIDTKDLSNFNNELIMTNVSSSIQFSKIFSEYIINKTYQGEIITEDLKEVQLKLISVNILKDMLELVYKRKYMIYLPPSIYKKEKKVKSLLNSVNDNYSQNKLYILIDLEILKFYNELILKLKREGYKFIIELSIHNIRLYEELKKYLSLVDYIIITDGVLSRNNIQELIPSYLSKKIIYTNKSLIEGAIIK